MNIYDKKQIKCARCEKFVGEAEINAKIIYPLCGDCADPYSDGFEKIQYAVSEIKNKFSNK